MDVDQNLIQAWQRLKALYPRDEWFSSVHLEENKPRLLRMMGDLQKRLPPGTDRKVVDVGCFNGFLCYLTSQLGYQAAGIDALDIGKVPERTEVMAAVNAPFYEANLNHLDPFPASNRGNSMLPSWERSSSISSTILWGFCLRSGVCSNPEVTCC